MISDAAKDRSMQTHLAQARGAARNGDLLRQASDRALAIRAQRDMQQEIVMSDALIDMLTQVTNVLENHRILHAVTGSVASSLYGEFYESVDADIVLVASPKKGKEIAEDLTPRFYAPEDMLTDAADRHAMTNIVDNRTGMKVDLSFIGPDDYLRNVLARRVQKSIGTHPAKFWFVTPEDVVLMKLLWRRDTQSRKQWENALSVVRIQRTKLDWKFMFERASQLKITKDLETLRDEAGI